MAKTSPTQRSLKLLRGEGYVCQIVEHFNMFAHVRVDLFGFIDIVAMKVGEQGLLGVQTTSSSNSAARVTKIKGIPEHKLWLSTGNRIEVHGWSKKGKAGKRKLWQVSTTSVE